LAQDGEDSPVDTLLRQVIVGDAHIGLGQGQRIPFRLPAPMASRIVDTVARDNGNAGSKQPQWFRLVWG
jgi:hypothetical protein